MQKLTENYLSKLTRYFYFVTSQHWIDYTVSDDDVANDSTFWRCKVYADIRGGSLEMGRHTTVG